MIVLADADVERAAGAAVYYGMQNSGQTCIAVERVYVEAPVYDEFVDKVTRKVGALRPGVPGGPGRSTSARSPSRRSSRSCAATSTRPGRPERAR